MTADARQNIPDELRPYPQWICHDADKRPINPHTGQLADVSDPTTWGSFDQACAAHDAGRGVGIGFVFTEADPFVGIDLDVPEGGKPSDGQQRIYNAFDSYAEKSPSGRGLHIIAKGRVPEGSVRNSDLGVEVYSSRRYFTFTGNVMRRAAIADCQPLVDALCADIAPKRDAEAGEISDLAPAPQIADEALTAKAFTKYAEAGRWYGATWRTEDDFNWSDAFFAVLCALCEFSADEAQVRRIVMASPLVQNAAPKGRETRAHKADRLWAREYARAAPLGAGERAGRQGIAIDLSGQLARALAPTGPQGGTPSRSNLIIRSMAEVTMEAIEYVWSGWVPKGYITLIGGETGSGKTSVVADMTARVSTGAPWPNETEWRAPAKVLWLGSEDGIADMTVPRLNACGANLHNIIEIQGVSREGVRNTFSLQDDILNVAALLDEGIAESRPYSVIVIDPITSYLSSANRREVKMNDAGQMRAVLEPWMDVAQRYGVSIICITHLAKDTNRSMLHRFLGSSAFTHTCRSLIAIVDRKTDDQPWAKAMVQVKTNLPDHPGGAFLFETERVQVGVSATNGKPIHATKPNWEDIDPLVTVDNLVPSSGARSERSLGFAMWLSQYFRAQPAGEEIEVSKVKAAALETAIVTEKQWERFSPKYLEKRNIMGTWYCRPIEKVE